MSARGNDILRAWGRAVLLCLCLCLAGSLWGGPAQAKVFRAIFQSQGLALTVEVLDDDLAHFELSRSRPRATARPIPVTPMIAKQDYAGPQQVVRDSQGGIRTSQMLIRVDPGSLAVTVFDLGQDPAKALTTLEPLVPREGPLGLVIHPSGFEHIYGLGEQFGPLGQVNGGWAGRARVPGISYGNRQVPCAGATPATPSSR